MVFDTRGVTNLSPGDGFGAAFGIFMAYGSGSGPLLIGEPDP